MITHIEWLYDLIENPFFLTGISSWFIAQIFKTIIHAIISKKFDFRRLCGDGGMPSGHSATVSSIAIMSALIYGTGSFQFAMNLAVELLKRLIAEQVHIYKRTNLVKSEKFSEIMQSAMNRYLNGMLTNEEVIQEMLNLAKQIREAKEVGEELGLTADELAFYDALTKPQAIKDFYENEELIAITKELTEKLRKNRTIDWQKRDSARAKMRMMIRKLLKDHRYPPEGMDDAATTVMSQCELWADNIMSV